MLRGWDNVLITNAVTTTTHAVLTITTHAVIFHTLVSYKRLRYIQPPLLARSSLLAVSGESVDDCRFGTSVPCAWGQIQCGRGTFPALTIELSATADVPRVARSEFS